MIEDIVTFAAPWLGVTDPAAISLAQGALLAGIILLLLYFVLELLVGLVLRAVVRR